MNAQLRRSAGIHRTFSYKFGICDEEILDKLVLELVLGDTLAHRCGAADTTADHLEHLVDIVGARPGKVVSVYFVGDEQDLANHF